MIKRITTTVFAIFILMPAAFADQSAEMIVSGLNLILHYAQTPKGEKTWIKDDEIIGCCLLRGTTLKLETTEGKRVEEQILGDDGFDFKNLKPGKYNITASHHLYNEPAKMTNISTGMWTNVDMPKLKSGAQK